ncbi:hypothetical protein HDU93_003733 [Gonapodya sp. JEL0774]|nr:hypothetical protein HDU93_003733 [Gonapodya sp. JEL0774]
MVPVVPAPGWDPTVNGEILPALENFIPGGNPLNHPPAPVQVGGLPVPLPVNWEQQAQALLPASAGGAEAVNWTLALIIGIPTVIAASVLVALAVVLTRRNRRKKVLRSYDRVTRVSMDPGRASEEEDETEDEEATVGVQLRTMPPVASSSTAPATSSSSSKKKGKEKEKGKDRKGKVKTGRSKKMEDSEED